ncbi:MAG: SIMPL domain-containing protein, partial [Lachnospiraceae bacterium]|nr:SIMPL domain-containing protein [Lachnospiraceae bacterium]
MEPTMDTNEKTTQKSIFPSLIIGVCIVLSAIVLTLGFVRIRQGFEDSISATGSASLDFESDLVVWRGSFSRHAATSKAAYSQLEADQERVRSYLVEQGIPEKDFTFSSVSIYKSYRDNYDTNGNYIGTVQDGYNLSQDVTVTSQDLDTVQEVSRDISTLLSSGIEFTSDNPEYYCTTLDQIKLDL